MLSNKEVAEDLIKTFGEDVFNFEEPFGFLTLNSTREQIIPIIQYLFNHSYFQVKFLTDLTGIHFPEQKGAEFAVIYHLHSLIHNFRLRIKVNLDKDDLHIPTATGVYESANWMERETFDFYGIEFDGHPKLIRILNIEEMDYFPMRKEYPLEDPTREDKIDALFGR
jgi:NADH-quinone oxidoreductase subunit C